MEKKTIAFVAEACCVRVLKEATALKEFGYDIILITNNKKVSTKIFKSALYYEDTNQLATAIRAVGSITRLFQVHNEPSWPVSLIRDILQDAIIIMDYHDSNYWRVNSDEVMDMVNERLSWFEEDTAVIDSDAFVVPSDPCQEELATRSDKKIIVIPSAVPLAHYGQGRTSFMGGLVSQGGHVTPDIPGSEWRDFTKLYEYMRGKKQVYAYSANFGLSNPNAIDNHYHSLGIQRGRKSYNDLLQAIGGHTWNLVGNWNPDKDVKIWSIAQPNKFFDSMANLTPNVIMGVPESAKIVEEYDIGIVVEHPSELIDRWEEHSEKRVNLRRHRMKFTMENFIPRLIKLYGDISGGEY